MDYKDFKIENHCFVYNQIKYDCHHAANRDIELILNEAVRHEYDAKTLSPVKIRVYVNENDEPIFGMMIYSIKYISGDLRRCACGGFYPFTNHELLPHIYQESICW